MKKNKDRKRFNELIKKTVNQLNEEEIDFILGFKSEETERFENEMELLHQRRQKKYNLLIKKNGENLTDKEELFIGKFNNSEYQDALYSIMDKEDAIYFVESWFAALEDLPKKFKNDREVVLAAVRYNGENLKYAPEKFKKDKEVVMEAVKLSGWDDGLKRRYGYGISLEFAHNSLKKDK